MSSSNRSGVQGNTTRITDAAGNWKVFTTRGAGDGQKHGAPYNEICSSLSKAWTAPARHPNAPAGDRLRAGGRAVLETAEPGGPPIGMKIRRILLDSRNQELSPTAELLLYFASRAQNVDEWIRPALERGEIVLSDRFTDSSLVYQGCGRGLGADTVLALDRIACRGLKPDLTILVDVDAEASLARARARNAAEPHSGNPHGRPVARLSPQGPRRLSRAGRRRAGARQTGERPRRHRRRSSAKCGAS